MKKTLISDEPLTLDDILKTEDDGGPEEEKPYDPMPERQPVPAPKKPEGEPKEPPKQEPFDGNAEVGENTPSPVPIPAGEPPVPEPGQTAQTSTPLMGSEYSAPVATPSPPVVTYRSRISIVEAWRYPGQLAEAPDFIDRAWTAWAEPDILGHPAGPALKVPVTRSLSGPMPSDGTKLARIGDYVVRQMVSIVDTVEEEAIDVWPKDEFERLFIPVTHPSKRKAA